jgi:hypothetical protein
MTDPPPLWARIIGGLGLAVHVVMLYWYAASGLVVPAWALLALLVVWIVLLVVAIRLLRTRPALVPVAPVAAALIWLGVVSAGGAWFGWTA